MKEKNSELQQSVQVLLDTSKGWLLQKRSNKDGIFWPGRHGLWGGSFEPEDEGSPLKAAHRELFEETSLTESDVKMIKMDVVDYDKKVFINEEAAPIKVHYYYASLLTDVAVHALEGDGANKFSYDTKFENGESFTPYVADAVDIVKRFKDE